jgi:DDE superfamily endonuclease
VLHQVPRSLSVGLDGGYEGVEAEYPDVAVRKPIRRRRGHRLTALGCAYNQMVSRFRIAVEHVLCRVKKFGVLAGVYRGRWERHEDLFCVVSGLVNYKATGQLSLV